MQILSKDHRSTSFSSALPPALKVKAGEPFRLETVSLLTAFPDGNIPADGIVIPVTGPVWVDGARAGQTLRVAVERIDLSGTGVLLTLPGMGVLGNLVPKYETKIVRFDDRFVYFSDQIRVPTRKMIGKIGTSPKEPTRSGLPGSHGGNMDNTHIGEGSVIYLPVFVDGAYVYAGDLHAAQGDGEAFSGLESEGAVTLKADLRDDLKITDPIVVTADSVVTSGAAEDIADAIRLATRNALLLLTDALGLSQTDACMLCSIGCEIRISQITNTLNGAKVVIPRSLFDPERWL